jgi:high-affinity iron transporter
MKIVFTSTRGSFACRRLGVALFTAFAVVLLSISAFADPASPDPESLVRAQRVAHLVEYVGSDYAKAMGAGQPDEKELAEQAEVIDEAERSASGLGEPRDAVISSLQDLQALVKGRRPPAEVASAAAAIRRVLDAKFALIKPPSRPPSRGRGISLFNEWCAACHGGAGRGNGPRAHDLSPPPADFHAPDLDAALSPARVVATTRFGVPNTAMVPLAQLSDDDRWDVAFYVAGLAHPASDAAVAGARLFTLKELATESNTELRSDLRAAGFDDESRQNAAIDDLRGRAPYDGAAPVAGLAHAVVAIRRLPDLYAAGRAEEARAQIVATYLDDVEPVEPALRAQQQGVVHGVEAGFRELRTAVEQGVPPAVFASRAHALEEALSRASGAGVDAAHGGRASFTGTLLTSAGIALREGVEAALLIAALVSVLVRAGHGDRKRWVYAGCAAALGCGAITWVVAQRLLTFSGLSRETVEGISALLAAAVLFYVSYWLFAKRETTRWLNFLRQQITTRRAAYSLFGISFLAVYREAFETVLFYQALLADPASNTAAAALGVLVGVALLVLLVVVYGRAGKFAPPKAFFSFSSILLYALSFVFCGQGIAALQNADKLPLHPASLPQVPALGLYPTVETYAVQGTLLVAAFASFVVLRRRANVG